MKKRFLALALSLALCLGLALPASAAETDNLTPTEAQAYLKELNKYANNPIEYAGLHDMNLNGKPELLVLKLSGYDTTYNTYQKADIHISAIQNSAAIHIADKSFDAGKLDNMLSLRETADGKICVRYYSEGYQQEHTTYLLADGTAETFSVYFDDATEIEEYRHNDSIVEESSYQNALKPYQGAKELAVLATGGSYSWNSDNNGYELPESFKVTASQLSAKASAQTSSGTGDYGPVTIERLSSFDYSANKEIAYSVTFESAKVQHTAITIVSRSNGGEETKNKSVNLLLVQPGNQITISSNGKKLDSLMTLSYYGACIGEGIYTEIIGGALEGDMLYTGPVEKSFSQGAILPLGDYYIVLGEEKAATVGGFADVKSTDYFAAPVEWAVEQGITTGTSAGAFSPNATCTTGQIITFLWRASGSPKATGANPFNDVSSSDYYYQAALWAGEKGLVSGSAFQGNGPCTRAATVTYLWKLAGQPTAGGASFADVPASAGYAPAVAWAVQEGITSGTGANAFSPAATCTRGQIVTFLYRDLAD